MLDSFNDQTMRIIPALMVHSNQESGSHKLFIALGFIFKERIDEFVELSRIVDNQGYTAEPIPFMMTKSFKQQLGKQIEKGRSYRLLQICHNRSRSSNEKQDVSLVLRIHENVILILDYSYE